MRFWRRRRATDDVVDPVDSFVELGIPRTAARAVVAMLRSTVTDRACALLPGLVDGTGVRWIWAASATFPQVAGMMARELLPDLEPHREQAAALPGLWLHAVNIELMARHDAAHPDRPMAQLPPTAVPPDPSARLREVHAEHRALVDRAMAADVVEGRAVRQAGRAIARTMRAPLPDGEDPTWGGWSLLAVVQAFIEHEEQLPRPGRPRARRPEQQAGARAAGVAFELGRGLMIATALELIGASDTADTI